jgi:hypothetical protein
VLRRETYVRPPLVAAEAPSAFWSLLRYRLVAGVLLVIVLLALLWLFLTFSGVTGGEDPGFIGTLPAPVTGSAAL